MVGRRQHSNKRTTALYSSCVFSMLLGAQHSYPLPGAHDPSIIPWLNPSIISNFYSPPLISTQNETFSSLTWTYSAHTGFFIYPSPWFLLLFMQLATRYPPNGAQVSLRKASVSLSKSQNLKLSSVKVAYIFSELVKTIIRLVFKSYCLLDQISLSFSKGGAITCK